MKQVSNGCYKRYDSSIMKRGKDSDVMQSVRQLM